MKPSNQSKQFLASIFTGIALGVIPAGGATVTPPSSNSIFLGVRVLQGDEGADPGKNSAYLVNLGQFSTFNTALPGTSFEVGVSGVGDDLARIFGSNWSTRPDLLWGIFGTGNATLSILYGGVESVAGSGSSYATLDPTRRSIAHGAIGTVINSISAFSYINLESTLELGGSAVAGVQVGASGAASYIDQVGGSPDFGFLPSVEAYVAGDSVLNLVRYRADGGVEVAESPGYFTLSDNGTLTFTAIPEPSVSLLSLGGALVLAFSRRRPARA